MDISTDVWVDDSTTIEANSMEQPHGTLFWLRFGTLGGVSADLNLSDSAVRTVHALLTTRLDDIARRDAAAVLPCGCIGSHVDGSGCADDASPWAGHAAKVVS